MLGLDIYKKVTFITAVYSIRAVVPALGGKNIRSTNVEMDSI